ncbi:EamA family transporter [Paenibacillus sp. GD4]|jgi:bacterial/archaeal transporter family protein|uniref:EamA family transporter n=1 Tax=Paenibacillus TaxID=44249 RepID=UPI002542EC75|nr:MULTISPECIES: EamA family transporter [Paenibacillus]MDQ1909267.1 EamA family transporter [Paenibacillus sp. GD4]
MLWLTYAILSAVTAAMVSIFGKIGLESVDSNTATAVRAAIMCLFILGVVALQGNLGKIPELIGDRKALFYVTLSGIAGATSWIFYFLAIKYGKVSQVAPVDKLSVVLTTIAAILFLGEKISLMNGIGVFMIAVGVVIVALS